MASSVSENVFEGIEFFSEANSVLLMSLMEETQEDHDQYCGDDRLISMIQSLEAEISDPLLGYSACDHQLQRFEDGPVEGQDSSTSVNNHGYISWVDDTEVASSSQFDEMMNSWSSCGDEMDGIAMECEFGNYESDYSQFCYGVLLEQQHSDSYLTQESSDAVFSS